MNEAAERSQALPMSEALASLFQRMLNEFDQPESIAWDAGESTLDPAIYAMFPTKPGAIMFVHALFTPHEPRNDNECAHWERAFAMIDEGVFGAEDLFICEQIQLGLQAGTHDRFVLGRIEQHLRRFHGYIGAMLHADR